jgi:hypothetical protein
MKLLLTVAAVAFLLIGPVTPANAQNPNHLKCYKIRDGVPPPPIRYTMNLQGLSAEPGCSLRARASLLCVQTTKTSVSPTPPGGGPNPASAGKFLCYKVKCARQQLPGVPVVDQFGARTVAPRRADLLCAPASPSGAFVDGSPAF